MSEAAKAVGLADESERGTGRSSAQILEAIKATAAGESHVFITPGGPGYWLTLAVAICVREKWRHLKLPEQTAVTIFGPGTRSIQQATLYFRSAEGLTRPFERDIRVQGLSSQPLIIDHAVRP